MSEPINVRPAVQAVATASRGKDSSELLYMGSSECFQEQTMLDEVTISDSYGVNQPNRQSKMSSPDQQNKLFYRSEHRQTTAKMMSKMSSMEGKNIGAE